MNLHIYISHIISTKKLPQNKHREKHLDSVHCLASSQSSDCKEPFSMPIIPANGASSMAGWIPRVSYQPELKVRLVSVKLALSCS